MDLMELAVNILLLDLIKRNLFGALGLVWLMNKRGTFGHSF